MISPEPSIKLITARSENRTKPPRNSLLHSGNRELAIGLDSLPWKAAGHSIVSADRERRQISLRSTGNVAFIQQPLATFYNGTAIDGPKNLAIDSVSDIYFTGIRTTSGPAAHDTLSHAIEFPPRQPANQ